jgi:uncharacterized Zn-finger protein
MRIEESIIPSHKVNHRLVHLSKRNQCKECDLQTTRKSDQTRHYPAILMDITFICEQYDFQAHYKSNLTRHYQSVHKDIK